MHRLPAGRSLFGGKTNGSHGGVSVAWDRSGLLLKSLGNLPVGFLGGRSGERAERRLDDAGGFLLGPVDHSGARSSQFLAHSVDGRVAFELELPGGMRLEVGGDFVELIG